MADKEHKKYTILTKIQNELHAPKDKVSNYGRQGGYNYRSAEDIEQALKPLLAKYGATLYITEDVKAIGERDYAKTVEDKRYNKATTTHEVGNRFYFVETIHYHDEEQDIEVKGWAREDEERPGIAGSQVSGATSSYATKYALGKLFLIDNTPDADATGGNDQPAAQQPARKPAPAKKATKADYDKAALAAKTTVNGQPVLIVQLVAEAFNAGNEASKKALESLTGEDHKMAGYIYKQKLYKNWPN